MSAPYSFERENSPRGGRGRGRGVLTSPPQSFRGRQQSTKPLSSNKFPSRNFTKKQGTSRIGETSRHQTRIEAESDGSDGDDDWMVRDEDYDSEDLSLEIAKKSRWLRDFFERFDSLSDEKIDDPATPLHCPVCKEGPGAITWYKGFQTVLTHAENVRSKRMRLHRRFAELLDGEMRGRSLRFLGPRKEEEVVEWKGLEKEVVDHMIVWPPMVVVQNTRSQKDGSGKWVGVRKTDLLGCFKHYDIMNVKNAYGPSGHCGVSLLIFDSSAAGYFEAESLHSQFIREGRGKFEWENLRGHTHSAGKRLLYGYMATVWDMELFNRLSRGKEKHKFTMESYEMMVVSSMKKMMRDNDDSLNIIGQKLRLREIEVRTIRQRVNEELEESKKEIDYLDKHYADVIKQLSDDLEKAMKREEIQ